MRQARPLIGQEGFMITIRKSADDEDDVDWLFVRLSIPECTASIVYRVVRLSIPYASTIHLPLPPSLPHIPADIS